ncbi:NXPE family member 4-like [Hyla sarda]|uniref:NXPE family member 4-like n=1 Tax=Hyla sarda TaxID=327740 RepID=UPI0024C27D55|nr:NXPE family member 4-like [Hyla sarda]
MVARQKWRQARSVVAINKARIKVNKAVSKFVARNGGLVARHRDLEEGGADFVASDGIHLNGMGMDLWLLELKETVERALRLWRNGDKVNLKVMSGTQNHKIFVAITLITIIFISYLIHRQFIQVSPAIVLSPELTPNSEVKSSSRIILSEDERLILNKISGWIHTGSFNDTRFASSAKNSKATILNPRKKYCTGDKLTIQIDMFDYLGNRKTYGGDFIRSRIFNPTLNAGASGVVEDFNNGTYHVHFTLFWKGKVYISLLLYHSSEAASALWKARDNDYGLISFMGTFVNRNQSIKSECGFKRDSVEDVCEYRPVKGDESFYCIKQDNFQCGSLTYMKTSNRNVTFLKNTEKPLVKRENIAVNIKGDYKYIDVLTCKTSTSSNLNTCAIGMESPLPSGFVLQQTWNPVFCKIPVTTQDQMYACLKNKQVYFLGDSTMRQWFEYFQKALPELKTFILSRMAADTKNNILVFFKKHNFPFITTRPQAVKGSLYLTDEIDHLAGGPHHVLAITFGQHFRPLPIQLFIRRVMNIHRAVERLLLRSPDTKVIIKAENTREIHMDAERFSDFHGYIQNMIVKEVFKDLHVAFVDAWDMTIAFNSYRAHPLEFIVRNQINMFLSYICS